MPESTQFLFQILHLIYQIHFSKNKAFRLGEWQISLGLSSRIFFLTPYGGGTYLNSKLHIESGPHPTGPFWQLDKNKFSLGYFLRHHQRFALRGISTQL